MPRPPRFGVPGLTRKRGLFVFQPPAADGCRPAAIHLHTRDLSRAILAAGDILRRESFAQSAEPLAGLVEIYFRDKRASGEHRSRVTTLAASNGLRRLTKFFRVSIGEIRTVDLERWRDSLMADRLSRSTVASYLRYSQSFFSWAAKTGRIVRSPFEGAPRSLFPASLPTRRELVCPRDLRDRLLTECDHPDLAAVLHFGFLAGLRRQEILAIRPGWILTDPATGAPTHLHVRNEPGGADGGAPFTVKDGAAKMIPIADTLARFMDSPRFNWRSRAPYLIAPDRPAGRWIYRWDWSRRWHTYMRDQGCPWVTPHVMRHTFVTLLLSAPPDRRPSVLHLSRWTGTAAATLDRHYAHLLEDSSLINAAG